VKQYKNTVNASTQITKTTTHYKTSTYTPTHYKTNTYALLHITKQVKTTTAQDTHQLK